MDDTTRAVILAAIARAPQWIRHDLAAKDATVRMRAEETLAAMVAEALALTGAPGRDDTARP